MNRSSESDDAQTDKFILQTPTHVWVATWVYNTMPTVLNALNTNSAPSRMTTAALIIGRRCNQRPSPVKRSITGFAITIRIPIATKTAASPNEKAHRIIRPHTSLPRLMANKSPMSASTHGTMPPEIPSDSNPQKPVRSEGTAWLCTRPP